MPETANSLLSPGRLRILLPVAVFVLALTVRLIGIGWGLKNDLHNQSYHPDEEDIFRFSQAVDPAHGKFTPGFYNYGTFYLTTLRVASDMTAAYTGGPDQKNPDSKWSYIARCNMAGRIISAMAGAGMVLAVFFILLRLCGRFGAAAGALILTFAPAHVVHSRFQTVDVMAVFLLALSVLFAFKFVPKEGEEPATNKQILTWLILSGVFAGLSGATKYTGVLGIVTTLVILFAYRRQTLLKDAAIVLGSTIAAFVIGCPGVLLDNEAFMRDFKYEMLHTSTGHGLIFEGTANGFVYHFANLLQGFGTIATLVGFGALAYAAYRKKVWAIALLAFLIPYYVLIGRAEVKFMRYTFPLYVGLAVGFGYAVAKGRQHQRLGRLVVGAGILAVGGIDYGGTIGTVRFTAYMLGEDPRDAAARYLKIAAQSAPSTIVGLPEDPWFWSAPLYPDSTISRHTSPKSRLAAMMQATSPKIVYQMTPEGNPTQFDKRLITDIKPDYVTYSSLESADPERLKGRTDVSDNGKALATQYQEFLAALTQDYERDRAFGENMTLVQDMAYIQPYVMIWKRKTPATR